MGKESSSQPNDSSRGPSFFGKFAISGPTTHEPNTSGEFFPEMEGSSSPPLEAELIKLNQKVNILEHELSEASAKVKAKESKVLDLENILNGIQLPKKKTEINLKSLQDKCEEMEAELERLFREKIEAEVEYLMITRTTQTWKVMVEEQKSLARDQAQMVLRLQETESKVIMVTKQAEELEASSRELLETEEVLKIQNDVCKLSFCCFFQFILLCIVLGMFLFQLMPHASGIAPT